MSDRASNVIVNEQVRRQYVVSSDDELTYVVWVLEGEKSRSALGWRDVATQMGLVDPMQQALPPGRASRRILGNRLLMGQVMQGY